MRGCERRVIMLKGTDSEIFDEAYFLLRRDFKNRGEEGEIVKEAQRIVSLNTTKKRRGTLSKKEVISFILGAVCGGLCAAFLMIILTIAK